MQLNFHLAKCFQIQNSHPKSMIVNRTLRIANHQNDILLQSNWKLRPIDFVQRVGHLFEAFRCQFAEKTVNKHIQRRHWACHQKNPDAEVNVFGLLKINEKIIPKMFQKTHKEKVTKSNWKTTQARHSMLQINWIAMFGLNKSAVLRKKLKTIAKVQKEFQTKKVPFWLTLWSKCGNVSSNKEIHHRFAFYCDDFGYAENDETFAKMPDDASKLRKTKVTSNRCKRSTHMSSLLQSKPHQNNRSLCFDWTAICFKVIKWKNGTLKFNAGAYNAACYSHKTHRMENEFHIEWTVHHRAEQHRESTRCRYKEHTNDGAFEIHSLQVLASGICLREESKWVFVFVWIENENLVSMKIHF